LYSPQEATLALSDRGLMATVGGVVVPSFLSDSFDVAVTLFLFLLLLLLLLTLLLLLLLMLMLMLMLMLLLCSSVAVVLSFFFCGRCCWATLRRAMSLAFDNDDCSMEGDLLLLTVAVGGVGRR